MTDYIMPSRHDQQRALWLSTISFTLCFAVWTIFSIIGLSIKDELGLSEFEYGVLIATPVLTGSIIRLILGVWTERYGGRLVFSAQMILTGAATFALTFAGVVQAHLQRVLGQSFMEVQDQIALFYWIRLGSGVVVVISALMFVWAVLVPGRERNADPIALAQPAE